MVALFNPSSQRSLLQRYYFPKVQELWGWGLQHSTFPIGRILKNMQPQISLHNSTSWYESYLETMKEGTTTKPLQLLQVTVSQGKVELKADQFNIGNTHCCISNTKCIVGQGNVSNLRKHLVKHKIYLKTEG